MAHRCRDRGQGAILDASKDDLDRIPSVDRKGLPSGCRTAGPPDGSWRTDPRGGILSTSSAGSLVSTGTASRRFVRPDGTGEQEMQAPVVGAEEMDTPLRATGGPEDIAAVVPRLSPGVTDTPSEPGIHSPHGRTAEDHLRRRPHR